MSEQSNDSKDKLRYSVTYEVDKDFLCDQETIDEEFNGSWQEWLDFFAENEIGEVITGIGSDPLHIKVIDLELDKPLADTDVANPPSTPTSTDTKIEETKKPTSKDELNVLATDSDDIITKILFELKYGKNFSGTANLKKINEATTALKTLLTSEKNKARIDERNEVALDNYRGHTFSDSTNYGAKFAKFIDNNEKRLAQLNSLQGE